VHNLTSAQDNIRAADIPSTVASMAKYSILEQTGVASLSQANQMQQLVQKQIQ
jgi:flagellin-like hook-associated protein FlgL